MLPKPLKAEIIQQVAFSDMEAHMSCAIILQQTRCYFVKPQYSFLVLLNLKGAWSLKDKQYVYNSIEYVQ